MKKILPKEITSYDLLKAFAVITMIVDHVGVYFYPDDLWWRAAGRLSAPVWLFLIGYARSRDIPQRLWVYGLVLIAANYVCGMSILPLNILFSILCIRLILDKIMKVFFRGAEQAILLFVVLCLLMIPTYMMADYGTMGLMFAIFGYLVRHKEGERGAAMPVIVTTGLFCVFIYTTMGWLVFDFTFVQAAFVFIGVSATLAMLSQFRSRTYPRLTATLSAPFVFMVQILGRRTLEVYTLHILMFSLVATAMGVDQREFFSLIWLNLEP